MDLNSPTSFLCDSSIAFDKSNADTADTLTPVCWGSVSAVSASLDDSAVLGVSPYSNTGRKKTLPFGMSGIDEETGEPFQISASCTNRIITTRHLVPAEPVQENIAIIDAVAFSIMPPEITGNKDEGMDFFWVLDNLKRFMTLTGHKSKNGLHGFKYSVQLNDGAGVIAWGGDSQRGRVWVSLMGTGCNMVHDWQGLSAWLELHHAKLTRVDVAHDDFSGEKVNMEWAVKQYFEEGGFKSVGRNPAHELRGDWLLGKQSRKGRTLYIGSRVSGKMFRAYEKGKQLGDPESGWVRVEVEWRAQDRLIPYDILLNPSAYLAGAYPCLNFLDKVQQRIKTITKASRITFDCAMTTAKQQYGKLINLAVEVFDGDYCEVIGRLRREGHPKRIEPYSHHIRENPCMLDPDVREVSS